MSVPSRFHARLPWLLVVALVAIAAPRGAPAQDGIDDIFDTPKPADAKPLEETPPASDSGDDEPVDDRADRDRLGFTQENAAAQMSELEERMFRLSEALLSLEPENASRLRLALKFSREELILQQMRETSSLLEAAQLSKAETEVRQLLAKLEHLRNLLLAEDLDFQLKLARLRQMRETLAQLERIIKEEQRELAWSRSAIERQEEADALRSRRADLEAIIGDQQTVLDTAEAATDEPDEAERREAIASSVGREAGVREAATALAADPLFSNQDPPLLKHADPHVQDTMTHLEADDLGSALESGQVALDLFLEELARLDDRLAELDESISPEAFQAFERDQARNREATDTLGQVSARLGDSGVALQKDLIRSSGSMREAEGNLAKTEAEPAADHQLDALKHLLKSRGDLSQAMEKLLVELRTELQAQIVAELAEMHEIQAAIRESTEAQAPRVSQGSRTALIALATLARNEADLADRIGHLTDLVEITEFGIALPTSLRVLGREMTTVEARLKAGDASDQTIALERRIEEDLLGLLQAMRRLPPTTPPPPGSPLPSDLRARERELNRLVAELKMIRLLQSRLNDDTAEVDQTLPDTSPLPADLRREVEALRESQDEIRESLSRIGQQLDAPDLGGLPDGGKVDL